MKLQVNNIIDKFASANRFEVQILDIEGDSESNSVKYSIKSVELPSIEKKTVDIMWGGRKYPVPRELGYKNTTEMTFYMIQDGLREKFLGLCIDSEKSREPKYKELIITHIDATENEAFTFDGTATPYKTYKFNNTFITEVGAVQLSSDNNGLLEFTVTFGYSDFEIK